MPDNRRIATLGEVEQRDPSAYYSPSDMGLWGLLPKNVQEWYGRQAEKLGEASGGRILSNTLQGPTRDPTNALSSFLSEGLRQDPGLIGPVPMEAAWKRAGVPRSVIQKLMEEPSPLMRNINQRNEVYHATDLPGMKGIFAAGEIRPLGSQTGGMYSKSKAPPNWLVGTKPQEFHNTEYWKYPNAPAITVEKEGTKFAIKHEGETKYITSNPKHAEALAGKVFEEEYPAEGGGAYAKLAGVSVSRVPRVKSKSSKAITLVLDPEKVPPSRPFAEPGWGKTEASYAPWWTNATQEQVNKYNELSLAAQDTINPKEKQHLYNQMQHLVDSVSKKIDILPSKNFEFENRTYNTPIPTSAVKKIVVDKEALGPMPNDWSEEIQRYFDKPSSPLYRAQAQEIFNLIAHPDDLKIYRNTFEVRSPDAAVFRDSVLRDYIKHLPTEHPTITEARRIAESKGIPLEIKPSGRNVHTERAQRSRLLDFMLKPQYRSASAE